MREALLLLCDIVVSGGALTAGTWLFRSLEPTPANLCSYPPPVACPDPHSSVIVACMNIPRGKKITADMIRVFQVPIALKHVDAATDPGGVLDHYSIVTIFAKEQILYQRLAENSPADDGLAYVISRGGRPREASRAELPIVRPPSPGGGQSCPSGMLSASRAGAVPGSGHSNKWLNLHMRRRQ